MDMPSAMPHLKGPEVRFMHGQADLSPIEPNTASQEGTLPRQYHVNAGGGLASTQQLRALRASIREIFCLCCWFV